MAASTSLSSFSWRRASSCSGVISASAAFCSLRSWRDRPSSVDCFPPQAPKVRTVATANKTSVGKRKVFIGLCRFILLLPRHFYRPSTLRCRSERSTHFSHRRAVRAFRTRSDVFAHIGLGAIEARADAHFGARCEVAIEFLELTRSEGGVLVKPAVIAGDTDRLVVVLHRFLFDGDNEIGRAHV